VCTPSELRLHSEFYHRQNANRDCKFYNLVNADKGRAMKKSF
jgi:hypothetical protein